jgi:hypothetical protein
LRPQGGHDHLLCTAINEGSSGNGSQASGFGRLLCLRRSGFREALSCSFSLRNKKRRLWRLGFVLPEAGPVGPRFQCYGRNEPRRDEMRPWW